MRKIQMTDVACLYNETYNLFDWVFFGSDIAPTSVISSDLASAILVSLATDADSNDPTFNDSIFGSLSLHRGYWGNIFKKRPIGSRLWMLTQMPITQASLIFAQQATAAALQWLLDYNIVGSLDITTNFFNTQGQISTAPNNGILIVVSTTQPNGSPNSPVQYNPFYQQAYQSALNPVPVVYYDSPYIIFDSNFNLDS